MQCMGFMTATFLYLRSNSLTICFIKCCVACCLKLTLGLKEKVVFPLTRPTLFLGADPKLFFGRQDPFFSQVNLFLFSDDYFGSPKRFTDRL